LGVEEVMVTTARRIAKPVSVLMLLAIGPGLVSAGPQRDRADAGAAAARTSDVASRKIAAPSVPVRALPHRLQFPAYSWSSPADPGPDRGSRPVDDAPRWFDTKASTSTPARTGSWWSRRTTAQKTWFIVGCVVGAVGIYAIVSNNSGGNGNDGGSGY
jgi:hypothetical protein